MYYNRAIYCRTNNILYTLQYTGPSKRHISDEDAAGTKAAAEDEVDLCADGPTLTICVPEDYMKFELPEEGERATHVSIGVDIKDIPKVNDKDFSITLNAYFIVKWRDQRLIVTKRNRTAEVEMRKKQRKKLLLQQQQQQQQQQQMSGRSRPILDTTTTTTALPSTSRSSGVRLVRSVTGSNGRGDDDEDDNFAGWSTPSVGRSSSSSSSYTSTTISGSKSLHSPPAMEDPSKLTAVNLQILQNLWLPDVEILNLKVGKNSSRDVHEQRS